jgi:hypothetical protein
MWKSLIQIIGLIGSIVTIMAYWDDLAPTIVEFHPISASYQLAPGTNDTYVCTSACGTVVLQWRVQGRQSSAFLDKQPVALSSERSFDATSYREVSLIAKGIVRDEYKTVKIVIKQLPQPTGDNKLPDTSTQIQHPGPEPSGAGGPTSPQPPQQPGDNSTNSGGSQTSTAHSSTVTILTPKVGPIFTKNQVSAQVTSQIAAYFRARNYELAPMPSGVHSLDQYVSMSRNNAVPGTGWVVQAEVEMRPTYQPRNPGGVLPNQALPSASHAIVDMTMNCSITINMVRLPLGDHPATAVGLGKTVRTVYMTAMTGTVRDYEFSRAATEKATANALVNLPIEVWK